MTWHNEYIHYLWIAPLIVWSLWVFYLAVMNLKRAKDAGTLSKPALILGLPVLWTGLLLDVLCNWFVMTILFLEPPFEFLVTERLTRHANDPNGGWRTRFALWFGEHLLNPFDPSGNHLD